MDEYDWSRDAEPFYTFLGIYLVAFQWLEDKVDQILLLEAGFENYEDKQAELAKLSFYRKANSCRKLALESEKFARCQKLDNWERRVDETFQGLDRERDRRNSIMHSRFMLRGVEHGFDAIRTDKKFRDGKATFDHELLSRRNMDQMLDELAQLSFALGQLHTQMLQLVDA